MNPEKEQAIKNLLENSFLKRFLDNENVTDIIFNGTTLFVQDNIKGANKADFQPSKEEVLTLGKQIANVQGKEFANSEPILNTDLSYLRVNFTHTAVSPYGCTFALRVSKPRLAIKNLEEVANKEVALLLEALVKADQNIVISGKTGSGKTELQKRLVGFISDTKVINIIEDTMDSHIKELYPEKNIISWRTLTENSRDNKIDYGTLIESSLRNNPDWLIVAETRGSEAYHMLNAALTDHSIITTIHAKTAEAIPSRILSMIGQKYQINEILKGKEITDTLRFGIYMEMEQTEQGIKRFIRQIVEFTDFTNKGAVSIPIYRVEEGYDEKTQQYKKMIITNPLSHETIQQLKNKRLYHLVPEKFLPKN